MPYLAPADYLERSPTGESVRLALTDDSLASAIADQDQIIDAYLSGRYTLPFTSTHPILEGISFALTREALHRERPTPAVTEQADRARAQLRDLAAGRANIPIASGDTAPATNPGDLAVRAYDARPRVFGGCALDDYVNPYIGPYGRTPFDGPGNF